MNTLENIKTLYQVIAYRLTQNRYDLDYCPSGLNPKKFASVRDAIRQIENGSTIITAGMASHSRCSLFFNAVRDLFKKTGNPSNLRWISVSAQGGRGKEPGTIEELAEPGLLSEYITGHLETAKTLLALGDEKKIELHVMPQGEITALLVAQAKGDMVIESKTGIGTFLDPELGGTTAVTPHTRHSYISKKNGNIAYTLPKIDVALFCAPYADREGNIYFMNASSISESKEAALAAYHNGGKVIPTVCDIIEKNEAEIGIPKEVITSIIVNPFNEQAAGVRQKKYFPLFTAGATVDVEKAVKKLQFINKLARVNPVRTPVENAMARMAAMLFTTQAKKGDLVNLGIGLPEEVGRLIYEGGLHKDLTFSSESGPYGGIPAAGLYFGGSINPKELKSSAWMFNHYKENLSITVLGILQVDSQGNVNVSRRGDKVSNYVGPGGFMNISNSAKTVIFLGSYMAKAKTKLKKGNLIIEKKGIPKFVDKLNEVTFNAKLALESGKKVFYVTTVGIFRLTKQGVELVKVMPGLDIQKDILDNSSADIIVPENVEVVSDNIITGTNYKLQWA